MNKEKELYKNVSLRPFQYNSQSVRSCVLEILILLLPQLAMLIVTKSLLAICVVLCSIIASCASEFVASKIRKNPVSSLNYLMAVLQGALIGLLLPENYNIFGVFLIVFSSQLLLKYSYGSFSDNWINPIALTVCVAYILGQTQFPPFLMNLEKLQTKNPSLSLIAEGVIPVSTGDLKVTSFLNSTVFKLFKISIPEGYITLLWDTHSPIPAFRFNFITLISSIVLFSSETISCLIPGLFISVYSVCALIFVPLISGGPVFQGDVLLALFTSGILFSSLFVLQWYGTTPITTTGKVLYAIFAGLACFLINGAGTSPIGTCFTILCANVFSTFIQFFEDLKSSKKLRKILIPKITEYKCEY